MGEKPLCIFVMILVSGLAKDGDLSELPLCPTRMDYFPQNLPMHCRMPRSIDVGNTGSSPPSLSAGSLPQPFYQSPPSDKVPSPIPIPISPGGPVPYPYPGGPYPMPMPMPIPQPGPAHKLPVIVMPFYSPDPSYKKPTRPDKPGSGHSHSVHTHRKPRKPHRNRRPRKHHSDTDTDSTDKDSDTDTDTDTSEDTSSDGSSETSSDTSSDDGWWNFKKRATRRSGRRSDKHFHSHKSKKKDKTRDLLTPVLQYVTKDGYVIFEKKISKVEAKDWLKMRSDDPDPNKENSVDETKRKGDNGQFVEIREHKTDDNVEYQDKSSEKEITTEKAHMHIKHKQNKKE